MITQHDAALTAFAAWAQIHDKPAFEMFTALGCFGRAGQANGRAATTLAGQQQRTKVAANTSNQRYNLTAADRQKILQVMQANPGPQSIEQLRTLTGLKRLMAVNLAGLIRNGYLLQDSTGPTATYTFKSAPANVESIQSAGTGRGRRKASQTAASAANTGAGEQEQRTGTTG